MVLYALGESWQHHESHVADAEESEWLSCGRNDSPSYRIIRQLRQLLVFLWDAFDGPYMAIVAVCLNGVPLGAHGIQLQVCS